MTNEAMTPKCVSLIRVLIVSVDIPTVPVWEVGRSGPGCQNRCSSDDLQSYTSSEGVIGCGHVCQNRYTTQVWEGSSKDVKCVAGVTTNSATATSINGIKTPN